MRFIKYILCTILFTIFLGIGAADAQVRVVNEDGDVILLMPDGTWKYEDEKKESQRTDKNSPPPKNVVPASSQKIKKTNTKGTKNGSKNTNSSKSPNNKTSKSNTKKATAKKPKKTSVSKTSSTKQKKQKATVYSVPQRARKIKTPVISEQTCEYSMRERDEFTNKLKVATKSQPFFAYTQEDLKKFMREDDYLTCTGNLSRVVGMTIFNAKFEIESTMAQQEYGTIEDGTQMLVKLLNDETVILTCKESDKGTVDETNGVTIYRTYFIVDKNDIKELKKSEVVRVRMLWSTGFEDYEVNELDFFINQLKCLDQVND